MAGIYIHIPFCRKACHYCNFHFSTTLKSVNDFTEALLKEIVLQKDYFNKEEIDTIYFGGGTPSLLEPASMLRIMEAIRLHFNIHADAEITVEANPDDIQVEKLECWQQAGVNRLSIGIQSFFEEDLQWMNRAHHAKQAKDCILLVQAAGFKNLSIDLIYGSPTLTDENWMANIQMAIGMNIPHLSCYALTVEPATALAKLIQTHKKEPVDPEKQARHFMQLMDWMDKAGLEHYEISNFCKPGFRSRHNTSYWSGKKYLGLGPSAHSYNLATRQWNISNNAAYIHALAQNKIPFEVEHLTPVQKINEYIMTALRTLEGVQLLKIREEFGENYYNQVLLESEKYLHSGKLVMHHQHLRLSKAGKLFADGIAADLFFSASYGA